MKVKGMQINYYKVIVSLIIGAASFYAESSLASREDCDAWCRDHTNECVKCARTRACGAGHEVIRQFRQGANWYACGRNSAGVECQTWCRSNPTRCAMCSTLSGCGPNYTSLREFNEPGIASNWYACRPRHSERGEGSELNREECERWCAANPPCVRCDTMRYCGTGFRNMESFDDHSGRNWHACRQESASCCPVITRFRSTDVGIGHNVVLDATVTYFTRGDRAQGRCNGRSTYGRYGPLVRLIGVPTRNRRAGWDDDGEVLSIHVSPFNPSSEAAFQLIVPAGNDEEGCPSCEGGGDHCASASTPRP